MIDHSDYLLLAALVAALAGSRAAATPSPSPRTTPQRPVTRETPRAGRHTAADEARRRSRCATSRRPIEIQHIRPPDQRGMNVFESPKEDGVAVHRLQALLGRRVHAAVPGPDAPEHRRAEAASTRQASTRTSSSRSAHGFNNAVANLYLNAQLARGIRVAMTSYLSARHHQETWVKDGYFLIDDSPIDNALLNKIMKYATLKVGHFEINYGDAALPPHATTARRSSTRSSATTSSTPSRPRSAPKCTCATDGFMAMGGVTGGEVHGQVTAPASAARATSASSASTSSSRRRPPRPPHRLDVQDGQVGEQHAVHRRPRRLALLRRAREHRRRPRPRTPGRARSSRDSEQGHAHSWSTRSSRYGGAEFFGNFETQTGAARGGAPATARCGSYAGEGLYRFADDKLYVGGRYNTVKGQLPGITNDITVNRYADRRRLVRDAERALEARVREPEVPRLPDDRHPQRRQVQGLHGRGRRRLLTASHRSVRAGGAPAGAPGRLRHSSWAESGTPGATLVVFGVHYRSPAGYPAVTEHSFLQSSSEESSTAGAGAPGEVEGPHPQLTSSSTSRTAYAETRRWLIAKHGSVCAYCGHRVPESTITLDHVTPRRGRAPTTAATTSSSPVSRATARRRTCRSSPSCCASGSGRRSCALRRAPEPDARRPRPRPGRRAGRVPPRVKERFDDLFFEDGESPYHESPYRE